MNKFEFFTPLMHKNEYLFIEKFLKKDDILLEYGSGAGTIYFSGIVSKVIAIEHDIFWFDKVKSVIDNYSINNIELYHVKGQQISDQSEHPRYDAFEDYITLPKKKNFKFTKVLIDGRARKYCAKFVYNIIDDDTLVFIHDFNFNNVEGYDDPSYFSDILSFFDIYDIDRRGQGIVALKRKGFLKKKIKERNESLATSNKKEIIISHYQEDLSWVNDIPMDYKISIYSKGLNVVGEELTNNGREAHTYIHHIIENYENLSEELVFCQGNPFDHCSNFISELTKNKVNSFNYFGDTVLISDGNGQPNYMGMWLDVDSASNQITNKIHPSYVFTAGSQFFVSRDTITKHPIQYYKNIMKYIEENYLAPWELERIWHLIFEN